MSFHDSIGPDYAEMAEMEFQRQEAEWDRYWESLTPEQQAAEIRSMDEHAS